MYIQPEYRQTTVKQKLKLVLLHSGKTLGFEEEILLKLECNHRPLICSRIVLLHWRLNECIFMTCDKMMERGLQVISLLLLFFSFPFAPQKFPTLAATRPLAAVVGPLVLTSTRLYIAAPSLRSLLSLSYWGKKRGVVGGWVVA